MLVDMHTLEPGQPWPNQLHEMMGYCQAGILLLTMNSIKSPWVLKEATILMWRKAVEKKFELFVVPDLHIGPNDLHDAKFGRLAWRYSKSVDTRTCCYCYRGAISPAVDSRSRL